MNWLSSCTDPRKEETGDRRSDVCEAVPVNETDWEQRVAGVWASIDQRSEAEFLTLIGKLAAELPPDSSTGA